MKARLVVLVVAAVCAAANVAQASASAPLDPSSLPTAAVQPGGGWWDWDKLNR